MSYDSEDKPRRFYTILDDKTFLPRIVYDTVYKDERLEGMTSDFERDQKIAKEIHKTVDIAGLEDAAKNLKIMTENYVNLIKIREVLEKKEVPIGKDFYASLTLTASAEPTFIDFLNSSEYVNVPTGAVIPRRPGKKLFKITVKVATQPCQFSLNNTKFEKRLITTLNASEEYTFEAKSGVIENITLQATSAGNSAVRIIGFY